MLFAPKEQGQALVDYSLIILLVAIVVIAAVMFFGQQLVAFYQRVIDAWPTR
jgi:Flp pilus assembly pilin Flp